MKKLIPVLFCLFLSASILEADVLDSVKWFRQISSNANGFWIDVAGEQDIIDSQDNIILSGIMPEKKYINYLMVDDSLITRDDFNCALIKYDNNGKCKWLKTYKNTFFYAYNNSVTNVHISVDKFGNFFTSSHFLDTISFGDNKVYKSRRGYGRYIAKHNESGDVLWVKALDYFNGLADMCTDDSGNVYFISYSYDSLFIDNKLLSTGPKQSYTIVKLSSSGEFQWAKQIRYEGGLVAGSVYNFSLSYSNGDLFFALHEYKKIYLDSTNIIGGSYDRSYGIARISAANGSIKDFYQLGGCKDNGGGSIRIYFYPLNGSLYINGAIADADFDNIYYNNKFLMSIFTKFDIGTKTFKWKKKLSCDTSSVYTMSYPKFYNGNFYTLVMALGYINKDGNKIDNDYYNSWLAVWDTNGNWQRFDKASCGKKLYSSYIFLNSKGSVYLTGYFSDSIIINKKIKKYRRTQMDNFCLKLGPHCDFNAIDYADFKISDGLNLVNDAGLSNNRLYLTNSYNNKKGAVWHKEKVPVSNGFSTTFSFKMNNGKNDFQDGSLPGGDGFAFVIQNNDTNAIGSNGGGIGYAGIENSLAIEYDTYRDYLVQDSINDPTGNHIGIFCAGLGKNSADHSAKASLKTGDNIITLKTDGTTYYSKIEYDADLKRISVYLDTTGDFISPVLESNNIDLKKLLNIPDGKAFVGFTSATGSARETHELLSWQFCPVPADIYNYIREGSTDKDENGITGYPNPFVNTATIEFNTEITGNYTISLCDIYGQEVRKIFTGNLDSGRQKFNISSEGLSSGIYFVRVQRGNEVKVLKMELIK